MSVVNRASSTIASKDIFLTTGWILTKLKLAGMILIWPFLLIFQMVLVRSIYSRGLKMKGFLEKSLKTKFADSLKKGCCQLQAKVFSRSTG